MITRWGEAMPNPYKKVAQAVENTVNQETGPVLEECGTAMADLATCLHDAAMRTNARECRQCGAYYTGIGWHYPAIIGRIIRLFRDIELEMEKPEEPTGKA